MNANDVVSDTSTAPSTPAASPTSQSITRRVSGSSLPVDTPSVATTQPLAALALRSLTLAPRFCTFHLTLRSLTTPEFKAPLLTASRVATPSLAAARFRTSMSPLAARPSLSQVTTSITHLSPPAARPASVASSQTPASASASLVTSSSSPSTPSLTTAAAPHVWALLRRRKLLCHWRKR